MTLDRRSFSKALLAAASASFLPALPAWAQELKSLKIVAPAGPGGGYDQLARAVQDVLMKEKSLPACRSRMFQAPAAPSAWPVHQLQGS